LSVSALFIGLFPTIVCMNLKKVRFAISVVIFGLFVSGVTAFPLETEIKWLAQFVDAQSELGMWIHKVGNGLEFTNATYPFIAYGTDWLAFAHILLAILFIGPWIDPVKNIWVIQFGIISCIAVVPLALIAGPIRGIPLYWSLIDCSFGVFGILPLIYVLREIRKK